MDYRTEVHRLAENFRLSQGLGVRGAIEMRGLLDTLNILAVFKPLSQNFSGIAGKINHLNFMLINSEHSLGRQNFTISHELYHLFYDENMKNIVIDSNIQNAGGGTVMMERRANTFASYLLLPDAFFDLIPKQERKKNALSTVTLIKIEQYYRCSRHALLIRLNEIGLADKQFMKDHSTNISRQAEMLGYDTSLYMSGRNNTVVGNYSATAYKLFNNEIISESNFIQYMLDIGIDEEVLGFNEKGNRARR